MFFIPFFGIWNTIILYFKIFWKYWIEFCKDLSEKFGTFFYCTWNFMVNMYHVMMQPFCHPIDVFIITYKLVHKKTVWMILMFIKKCAFGWKKKLFQRHQPVLIKQTKSYWFIKKRVEKSCPASQRMYFYIHGIFWKYIFG